MKRIIVIPNTHLIKLEKHLFTNRLEQGAFLFSNIVRTSTTLRFEVVDIYLVPPEGWVLHEEYHLELKDTERAKIMKIARERNFAIVDCHSHPESGKYVWFSGSDRIGISEFATYVRWKLDGKPYAAMVWGESSVDCVAWDDTFTTPYLINEIQITGRSTVIMHPRNTWWTISVWPEFIRGFYHVK